MTKTKTPQPTPDPYCEVLDIIRGPAKKYICETMTSKGENLYVDPRRLMREKHLCVTPKAEEHTVFFKRDDETHIAVMAVNASGRVVDGRI